MITLCMDTSQQFLVVVLIKDNQILAQSSTTCFKKQSETIFPELIRLCDSVDIQPEDIDEIVITKGPGSYTGVRIAMTIAKVFCSMKKIPCYTLGTLQLYSGNYEDCFVLLDARSKRAYFANYNCGNLIGEIGVYPLDEIHQKLDQRQVFGDTSLIGENDNYPDLAKAFLDLKDHWELVENIHCLVPEYLKNAEEYLVK